MNRTCNKLSVYFKIIMAICIYDLKYVFYTKIEKKQTKTLVFFLNSKDFIFLEQF